MAQAYFKKVKLVELDNSDLTAPEIDHGAAFVMISKSDKTWAEINAAWTGVSGSDTWQTLATVMSSYLDMLNTSFPWLDPGTANGTPTAYEGFSTIQQLMPYMAGSGKSGSFTYTAPRMGIVDDNGDGVFTRSGAPGWYMRIGGAWSTLIPTLTARPFGFSSFNATRLYTSFLTISADDQLVGVTLYYNKTNSGIKNQNDATIKAAFFNWVNNLPDVPISVDPYSQGGESESGGGDGNFDFSSTVIPIPGLPNIGATDTGFISLYKPSATQLKALANYMWAGAFDVTQFKKLFADPMDAILGLHIIPTVSGHPATGSGNLLVGNIDTGLTMPTCLEQYYEADFGTVNIPAKWGAYLDYSPYTKLSLYLPYIGFVPISPDDCMRGSIKVVYHVDVLSGTCVAFVYCVSNRGADGHTLYMFNGSCSCDCPVTSGQYRSALEGLLGVAGSIGRVAAGDVAGGLKDAISNVTAMLKPEIGRSGSFGGAGGLMGIQYPYLVLTIPRMCIPGEQNTFIGYPSFVTKTIGDLTGYCSIDVSHLENMTCTEAEAEEIISILSEGVIL